MNTDDSIYKLSVDVEDLAYKISKIEDSMAELFAFIQEIKEGEDGARRMVS